MTQGRKKQPVYINGVEHWRCCACRKPKLPADFFKHAGMSNGLNPRCKSCRIRRRPQTDPDKLKQTRHERNSYYKRNRDAFIEYNKEYYSTPDQVNKQKARLAAYRNNNPEKRLAKTAVNNAVRNGRLIKPDCCERCGAPTQKERLHGHHADYSRQLDVEWLCQPCHGKEHRK